MKERTRRLLEFGKLIARREQELEALKREFAAVLGDSGYRRKARRMVPGTQKARVLAVLEENLTDLTAEEVRVRMSGEPVLLDVVRVILSKLQQQGFIERVSWGLYRAAKWKDPPTVQDARFLIKLADEAVAASSGDEERSDLEGVGEPAGVRPVGDAG